jgi:hypothetical protein
MKRILKIFLLISIIFFSCRKNIIKVNPDFQGTWSTFHYGPSGGTNLTIEDNGKASWREVKACYDCQSNNYSGIARIKDDEIKIGRKKCSIDIYPGYDTMGNYMMELSGEKFYAVYKPANVHVYVKGDSATFSWSIASEADVAVRNIDYRTTTSAGWTTIDCFHPLSEYTIHGLLSATTYEWRMRSTQGIHSSQYTTISTFTTQ